MYITMKYNCINKLLQLKDCLRQCLFCQIITLSNIFNHDNVLAFQLKKGITVQNQFTLRFSDDSIWGYAQTFRGAVAQSDPPSKRRQEGYGHCECRLC